MITLIDAVSLVVIALIVGIIIGSFTDLKFWEDQ